MKRGVLWPAALVAGLLISSPQYTSAQGPDARTATRSTRAGVYTAQQADRGRATYDAMCASCHDRASHSGATFTRAWQGRTLWDLYSLVSETMPKSDPGTLSEQEYVQVLAYLLRLNGLPAGTEPLPGRPDRLRTIRFEPAPPAPTRK